jgi:DNA modification methylase
MAMRKAKAPASVQGNKPQFPVEYRRLETLRPHPRNYRIHDEAQLAVVRQSLRTHGLQKPPVITADGMILAGHALVLAAKAEGWETIECHVYTGPNPDAFLVMDNRSAEMATNDDALLLSLLQQENDAGRLLDTGFDDKALLALLAESGGQPPKQPFDVEEAMRQAEETAPEAPCRVKRGEVWQCGRHRVMCGDATDSAAWDNLMDGKAAHAVITDPPYAVNYCGGRAAQEERIARARRGVDGPSDAYWDELTPQQYRQLLIASLALSYQHSDEHAPLYLWFASARLREVLACLEETGWQERNLLVWVKNNGAGALFAQYKHWYEPLFYAHKQGEAPRWHGPTNETTVWEHDKPARNELHPTMKPVPLIERAISNSSEPGHLVADPFLGSGTAIIAAQRTGRICYGMDLDARYCGVILTRWEAETGSQAVRVEHE